jgi:RNA polymerase sigma-70 factor, ECF subfamily
VVSVRAGEGLFSQISGNLPVRAVICGVPGGEPGLTDPGRDNGGQPAFSPATAFILPRCGRPPPGSADPCPPAGRHASVTVVEDSDALLAARLAAGDGCALAEVYDRFAPDVYRAALLVLRNDAAAQDIVQDVFVELWRHPGRYDPALGTFPAYLTVIARRRAVDVVRREVRRVARQDRSCRAAAAAWSPSPSEEVIASHVADAVRAAVRLLPDSQRRIVELAYFGGLTYKEAAEEAGVPEGTAKSRVRLAFAKLEAMLDASLLDSS